MPKIRHSAKITVHAAAEVVFDVVARDLTAIDDDPDKMVGHRPLDGGPLHFCAVAQREVRGGERWAFRSDRTGATVVELATWRSYRGAIGWLRWLRGEDARSSAAVSLQKRLAFVQFEAERRALATP